MINILIADDSRTSRQILSYTLLHFYDINIIEVGNGSEAVDICKQHGGGYISLIFMDVNMPIMDGLEATKQIRAFDSEVLIIGVSSRSDNSVINEMIKNGADDYVIKPFHTNILRQRIKGYLYTIGHRKMLSHGVGSFNVFNARVFTYFIMFKVSKEGHLAQFWEYFLNERLHNDGVNCFCSAVNIIFNIGTILLRRNKKFFIVIENDIDNAYFTITGIYDINQKVIIDVVSSKLTNEPIGSVQFLVDKNKLSLAVRRESIIDDLAKDKKEQETVEPTVVFTPSNEIAPIEKTLYVYSFIEQDDLADIKDTLIDLESTLAILQYSALLQSEVSAISNYIERIATLLGRYNETYDISIALRSLACDIRDNMERFIEKSSALSKLFIMFSNDLKDWQYALFITGAPSADFMDATIIADASIIANLIKPQEQDLDNDMDDIFSF